MPSGCISKHHCTSCADLLMNADHRPAPGRRVPLVLCFPPCEWAVQPIRVGPLWEKLQCFLSRNVQVQVSVCILSFQGRRHLRWNWRRFFTCQQYQVQDSLPYKSMVSATVQYTPIFVLRWIPWSDHSLWCNCPKLALALLIRERGLIWHEHNCWES